MKKAFVVVCFLFLAACNAVPSSGFDGPASSPSTMRTPSPETLPIVSNTPTILETDTATSVPVTDTPAAFAWTPIPSSTPRINTPLRAGLRVNISSIQMMDSQNGWGLDSDFHILKTQDGGNTWKSVTPPEGYYLPEGFFALDANTAWATFSMLYSMPVSAYVWHTTDGGQTWIASQEFSINIDQYGEPYVAEFYIPRQLKFLDARTGWLLIYVSYNMNSARPLLLQTDDGGERWTTINSRIEFPDACVGVGFSFNDSRTGWIGGNCFLQGVVSNKLSFFLLPDGWAIHKTVDGGRTYEQKTFMPIPDELQQSDLLERDSNCGEIRIVSFAQDVVGIEWGCSIFTPRGPDYKYFALSRDGGNTWHSWKSAGNEEFIDGMRGWRLLMTGELQQTVDGGVNWNTVKHVTWSEAQFDFINEQEGWAIVSNTRESTLLHTSDGGSTWQALRQVIGP